MLAVCTICSAVVPELVDVPTRVPDGSYKRRSKSAGRLYRSMVICCPLVTLNLNQSTSPLGQM